MMLPDDVTTTNLENELAAGNTVTITTEAQDILILQDLQQVQVAGESSSARKKQSRKIAELEEVTETDEDDEKSGKQDKEDVMMMDNSNSNLSHKTNKKARKSDDDKKSRRGRGRPRLDPKPKIFDVELLERVDVIGKAITLTEVSLQVIAYAKSDAKWKTNSLANYSAHSFNTMFFQWRHGASQRSATYTCRESQNYISNLEVSPVVFLRFFFIVFMFVLVVSQTLVRAWLDQYETPVVADKKKRIKESNGPNVSSVLQNNQKQKNAALISAWLDYYELDHNETHAVADKKKRIKKPNVSNVLQKNKKNQTQVVKKLQVADVHELSSSSFSSSSSSSPSSSSVVFNSKMKAAKESAPAQDKQEAAAEEIKTEKTEKTAKKGNKGPDSVDVLTRVIQHFQRYKIFMTEDELCKLYQDQSKVLLPSRASRLIQKARKVCLVEEEEASSDHTMQQLIPDDSVSLISLAVPQHLPSSQPLQDKNDHPDDADSLVGLLDRAERFRQLEEEMAIRKTRVMAEEAEMKATLKRRFAHIEEQLQVNERQVSITEEWIRQARLVSQALVV